MKYLVFLLSASATYAQCVTASPDLPSMPGPYTLPTAELGVPYTFQFQGSNGQPPYRFYSYQSRPLPSGFTLSESGELTGKPNLVKPDDTITILVRDARITQANICEFRFTVIPNRLAITSSTLPRATVGTPYSTTLSVAFGTPPFRFELVTGSYPPGLISFANGVISGTPTTPGTYNLRFRVFDANNNSATADVTLAVDGSSLRFETTSLPSGEVGLPYASTLRLIGSPTNPTFQLTSGTLPPGLALSPAGVIAGNPTTPGNFNFTIRATTTAGTADAPLTIRIASSTQPFSLQDWPTTTFTSSLPVNTRIPTIGAQGAITFTLIEGIIPAGLDFSPTGEVTGTPRGLPGTYTQRWRAVDSTNTVSERTYSITIDAPRALPPAVVGQIYSHRETAPGRYTLAPASRLPFGLTLNPDGSLSGTPFVSGEFTFAHRYEAGTAPIETRAYSLNIAASPTQLQLDTLDLPAAPVNTPYRQSWVSIPASTSLQIFDGTLPPGLSLQGTVISGTPTTTGYYEFFLDIRSGNLSTIRRYAISVESGNRPFPTAIVNSASYQGPAIAPGQIITLFGTNLDRLRTATIGVRNAHILYTTPNQAALIASHALPPGTPAKLTLTRATQETLPLTLRVIPALPGIFTQDGSGLGPAAALNQDATLNTAQNPAAQGSIVILYGTGLGPLEQAVNDGQPTTAANLANAFQSGNLTATVNETPATILYAGAAPGLIAGVDQFNIQLPPNLPPGPARLRLAVGSRQSPEILINVQ